MVQKFGIVYQNKSSIVEKFESNWMNWNASELIAWFKYILANNVNAYDGDEIKVNNSNRNEPDWNVVEQNLLKFEFCPHNIIPDLGICLLKHFGVHDFHIRQVLSQEIASLVQKYPSKTVL